MKTSTACAIFIPLSVAIIIASGNLSDSFKQRHSMIDINVEHLTESERKDYFQMLSYKHCVEGVVEGKSAGTNAAPQIERTCNKILN